MEKLYQYYISKLNYLDSQYKDISNLLEDFYKKLWDEIDEFFGTSDDEGLNILARDITEYLYEDELKKIIDSMVELTHFICSKEGVIENRKYDLSVIIDNSIALLRNSLRLSLKRIGFNERVNQFSESEITKFIEFRNKKNLEAIDVRIKSKLMEKNLTGKHNLESTSISLFNYMLEETFDQMKNEEPNNCVSSEGVCKKIRDGFSTDLKRASFERYCKKHGIDWKNIAKSKGLRVCKEKPSTRKDKIA